MRQKVMLVLLMYLIVHFRYYDTLDLHFCTNTRLSVDWGLTMGLLKIVAQVETRKTFKNIIKFIIIHCGGDAQASLVETTRRATTINAH